MEAVFAGEDLLLGKFGFAEHSVNLLYSLETLLTRLHRKYAVLIAGLDE